MANIDEVIARFPKRRAGSHKGDYGHVLVLAGSTGYTGAAYLASEATVRAGSGLVTLAVAKSLYPILAVKLTEAMVRPYPETKDGSLAISARNTILAFAKKCNSIAIGPGLSQNKETARLVRDIVVKLGGTITLDADGINAFCGYANHLKKAKGRLILTPHTGEMARLIGKTREEIQANRKDIALKCASEYNIVLVLKGHNTVVASPDGRLYVNETGNPGMASGGVGDVLTGVIAGFTAQGADPFDAAVLAVYFHGLAGDLAAKEKGFLSLTATDILNRLPEVLKILG